MTTTPTVDRIPFAHSVVYVVRGMPEIADEHNATRTIAPTEITLTYRAAPDSRLGRVHAYVKGWWMENGVRVPMDKPVGRHFYGAQEAWPEWLAEEARLHDPDVQPPVSRAAVLREAADRLVKVALTRPLRDAEVIRSTANELRRLADDEQPAGFEFRGTAEIRAAALREVWARLRDAEGISGRLRAMNVVSDMLEEQPAATPCDFVACEPGGEPCNTHEREESHADGEHELCGPECPATAEPTPLRWGLNDVLWGDDDTVTVLLSGPNGEPYTLELDPERVAVLRRDLGGPDGEEPRDLPAALRIVGYWYEDVNDGHGLDAGDLVHTLERAGFALPDHATPAAAAPAGTEETR